ncbi:MAG TPA: hypothetical protein VHQ41_03385 [Patescibacteria group bacterium]|jgi:hypothetical protein|nr:hypothetical protein [Patescibacteria group bacterium]
MNRPLEVSQQKFTYVELSLANQTGLTPEVVRHAVEHNRKDRGMASSCSSFVYSAKFGIRDPDTGDRSTFFVSETTQRKFGLKLGSGMAHM